MEFKTDIELITFVMKCAGIGDEWSIKHRTHHNIYIYRPGNKAESFGHKMITIDIYKEFSMRYVIYLYNLLKELFDIEITEVRALNHDITDEELIKNTPMKLIHI